jgi:putative ABC transport system ATP-binding protein
MKSVWGNKRGGEKMDVLLKLEGVGRTYHMGEVQVEALKATDLEIYQGEKLVILGPSGSGQSTMLNILGGMDAPSSGTVYFRQTPVDYRREAALTRYRRKQVGFIFQFYNLIHDLTAEENVALAAELAENPLSVREVMKAVGLSDRMNSFPAQMSGGEQQRVSIARALIKNPPFLLCDEPTGALDDETGRSVLKLLAEINKERGTTLIMVTHNTPLAGMADRVVRMRSGRVGEVKVNEHPLPPDQIEW